MEDQLTLFQTMLEDYKVSKPIRLITLFSGYDSQALSLKYLGVKFEHYRTCEWAIKSINALYDLHFSNDTIDYSQNKEKDWLVDYLTNLGISSNYNEPMNYDQINRLKEKTIREIYNKIIASHNLVNIMKAKATDLGIVETNKYDYIMTYSFPCQDLSLAGKRQGMSVSQNDGGTRSGLLWEVERLLDECNALGSLPQVLLMENVPQVIGTGAVKDFNKWLEKLKSLGYSNYFEVLNAKDYGIPQNRERCFMISILGEYSYKFPMRLELEHPLKGLLESSVDEKYYLNSKQIESSLNWNAYQDPYKDIKAGIDIREKISPTLTTRSGAFAASMVLIPESKNLKQELCDKLIQDNLVKENDVIRHSYSNNRMENMRIQNQEYHDCAPTLDTRSDCLDVVVRVGNYSPSGHNAASIVDENGVAPTVMENHGTVTAVAYTEKFAEKIKNNIVKDDIAKTLTANCMQSFNHDNCNLIIEDDNIYLNKRYALFYEKNGYIPDIFNPYNVKDLSIDGVVPSLTTRCGNTSSTCGVLIKEKNRPSLWTAAQAKMITPSGDINRYIDSKIIDKFNDGDCADISFPRGYNKANRVFIGYAPCLNTTTTSNSFIIKNNLRIRKLTPRECGRLQGVGDDDITIMSKGQSNASLYHLFGDSIEITCLMAIFGELLGLDYIEIIKKFIERNICEHKAN